MKKVILFIFLIVSNLVCIGQSADNYILAVNFSPSFIISSTLIVTNNNKQSFIEFTMSAKTVIHDKILIETKELDSLSAFLNTYKFQIRGNTDTIGSYKELQGKDSVTMYKVTFGLDGIIVGGSLEQGNSLRKFAFWSPNQGTQNAKMIEILLGLLNKSEHNQAIINYIEQLEQYFPHHLGLKKLSDNPLTYKLYGSVSIEDTTGLTNFFNSLEHEKKVLIDMSNFSNMGTLLYPIFENYYKKYQNIYWLNPTFMGLKHLYKMGISNEYIISQKKIISIKEENGSEVITTK